MGIIVLPYIIIYKLLSWSQKHRSNRVVKEREFQKVNNGVV